MFTIRKGRNNTIVARIGMLEDVAFFGRGKTVSEALHELAAHITDFLIPTYFGSPTNVTVWGRGGMFVEDSREKTISKLEQAVVEEYEVKVIPRYSEDILVYTRKNRNLMAAELGQCDAVFFLRILRGDLRREGLECSVSVPLQNEIRWRITLVTPDELTMTASGTCIPELTRNVEKYLTDWVLDHWFQVTEEDEEIL